MPRALCLTLLLCSCAFAQISIPASAQSPEPVISRFATSSAVQVVYVVNGTTLTIYNIDPQTLQPTQVGAITLHASASPAIVTSPDGRFLYFRATASDQRLYVYDTNATGVPNPRPAQTVVAKQLFGGVFVHPNGKFLYAVAVGAVYVGPTANYVIVRNLIDQNNGRISQPVTEASYQLPDIDDAGFCTLNILGFAPGGDMMYDDVYCTYPLGTTSVTYNQRSVNLQTGALGPDEELYFWNYEGGGENVQFANNRMFDFAQPPLYQQNIVTVYPVQAQLGSPIVTCTASMLLICSNFQYGLAHPSGQYAFLIDPNNFTDVEGVDSGTQQLMQTSEIPYNVQEFSPDGTIAYGTAGAGIEISGFDASNGRATPGGVIDLTSGYEWFTAERY
jgi:hypothetical protein